jgi:TIR domain-containing protein
MIPESRLAAWIERLERAGLDLDVPVLLDALWLAGKRIAFESQSVRVSVPEAPLRRRRKTPRSKAPAQQSGAPEDARVERSDTTKVYAHAANLPRGPSVKASPIAVPAAPALHQTLALARALRPLRQRRRSPSREELDEEATVHATAEQLRGVKPVFVPVREPWYEAAVVVEDDPAMHVWHDTVRAFVHLLERTGAFRDVRLWRLQMTPVRLIGPSGTPVRSNVFESTYPKRLILFVTHGVSSHWFDGRYAQVLGPWSHHASLLLVHLLPPHLWKLTELGEPRALVQTVHPGQVAAELNTAPLWWLRGLPPERHRLSLPVASLDAASLGTWAEMQMARGSQCPAMIVDTRVRAPQRPEPTEDERVDYEQAVAFFRSYATDEAWNLSIALSTSAFTLPVARVIQAARWGRAASHTHLAEILLSGLVRTRTPINETTDPNEVYYEFYPEARSILQRSLRDDDRQALANDLEEYVSLYLQQAGAPTKFRALVRDEKGNFNLPGWAQPFAHVGTALLGATSGPAPEELVERFGTAVPAKVFHAVTQLAAIAIDPGANVDLRPWMADRVASIAKLDVDLWQVLLEHRLIGVHEDGWWEFGRDVGERLESASRSSDSPTFGFDVSAGPETGFKRRIVIASDERDRPGTGRHAGSFRVLQIQHDSSRVSVAQQRREAIASADIVVAWESDERNWPELALAERFGRTVYRASDLADPDVPEDLLHLTLAAPLARMSGVALPEDGTRHKRVNLLVERLRLRARPTIVLGPDEEMRTEARQALWDRPVRERFRKIEWRTPDAAPSSSPDTLTVIAGRERPFEKWPTTLSLLLLNPDLDVYGSAPRQVRWVDFRHIRRPKGMSPGEHDVRRLQRHVEALPWRTRGVIGVLSVLEGEAPTRVLDTIPSELISDFLAAGMVRRKGDGFLVRACLRDSFSSSVEVDSHRAVLRAYRFDGATAWRTLEDDGYIYNNLFRHLIGAGMTDWATRVATRTEWWDRRVRAGRVEDDLTALGRIGESPEVRRAIRSAERDAGGGTPFEEPTIEPPAPAPTPRGLRHDIFLCYAREDDDRAKRLVDVLQAKGWSVFWDQGIRPGSPFAQEIETEISAAKCAIVLWSRRSVESAFVRNEASFAMQRGALLPVLFDDVKPPLGFEDLVTWSLVGWSGQQDDRLDRLVADVTDRIGRSEAFVWPIDANLVTGARDRHPDLGPTVNMMCRATNNLPYPIELSQLEIRVSRDGEAIFHLRHHLFYNARGGEHTQVAGELPVIIIPDATWESGVQFRDVQPDISNVWPAGRYEFELIGLAATTSLRTTFRANVEQYVEKEMTRWRNASTEEWNASRASDRALGFPLRLTDIKVG